MLCRITNVQTPFIQPRAFIPRRKAMCGRWRCNVWLADSRARIKVEERARKRTKHHRSFDRYLAWPSTDSERKRGQGGGSTSCLDLRERILGREKLVDPLHNMDPLHGSPPKWSGSTSLSLSRAIHMESAMSATRVNARAHKPLPGSQPDQVRRTS